MLVVGLSIFFSIMSTVVMTYLTMNSQVGPWFAPIFVISGVVLLSLVNRTYQFMEQMLFVIASGSVGGMVGVCLGSTIPVLHFLHEDLFVSWSLSPVMFSVTMGLFVMIATLCAFAIVYLLKVPVLKNQELSFPMSQFFYDLLYTDRHVNHHISMAKGLLIAVAWEGLIWVSRVFLLVPYIQLQVLPFMLTIGFLTGWTGTVPVAWGIGLQYLVLWITQFLFSSDDAVEGQVIITIVIGMLLSWLVYEFGKFVMHHVLRMKENRGSFWRNFYFWLYRYKVVILSGVVTIFVFKLLSLPISLLGYIIMATLFLSYIVARSVGEVGVVDVQSFSWILIFPLMCLLKLSVLWLLLIATLGLLIFGIVIDLLFSYKIAQLLGLGDRKLLKHQFFGCVISACCVGFILWWFMYKFGLHDNEMVYSNALELSQFIKYQVYDYRVVGLGMCLGLGLIFLKQDMLCIAGAMLLSPMLGIMLIIAGYFSSRINNPVQWYPLCFGFYAGYSVLVLLVGLFG